MGSWSGVTRDRTGGSVDPETSFISFSSSVSQMKFSREGRENRRTSARPSITRPQSRRFPSERLVDFLLGSPFSSYRWRRNIRGRRGGDGGGGVLSGFSEIFVFLSKHTDGGLCLCLAAPLSAAKTPCALTANALRSTVERQNMTTVTLQ